MRPARQNVHMFSLWKFGVQQMLLAAEGHLPAMSEGSDIWEDLSEHRQKKTPYRTFKG
jgi:hypothetical protein